MGDFMRRLERGGFMHRAEGMKPSLGCTTVKLHVCVKSIEKWPMDLQMENLSDSSVFNCYSR